MAEAVSSTSTSPSPEKHEEKHDHLASFPQGPHSPHSFKIHHKKGHHDTNSESNLTKAVKYDRPNGKRKSISSQMSMSDLRRVGTTTRTGKDSSQNMGTRVDALHEQIYTGLKKYNHDVFPVDKDAILHQANKMVIKSISAWYILALMGVAFVFGFPLHDPTAGTEENMSYWIFYLPVTLFVVAYWVEHNMTMVLSEYRSNRQFHKRVLMYLFYISGVMVINSIMPIEWGFPNPWLVLFGPSWTGIFAFLSYYIFNIDETEKETFDLKFNAWLKSFLIVLFYFFYASGTLWAHALLADKSFIQQLIYYGFVGVTLFIYIYNDRTLLSILGILMINTILYNLYVYV